MKNALKIILASAVATAVAIKAAPAFAQAPAQAETVVSIVRTADLDLASRDGQRLLDRRLVTAASEVCGIASGFDLEGQNDVRRCRDDVLASARAKALTVIAGRRGDGTIIVAARD